MTTTIADINAGITVFIAISGATINFMIIYAFVKVKALRNTNNIFLFQLAIVDLVKSILILPVKAYNQFEDKHSMSSYYCQPSGFISAVTFLQSALLLAAIAIVRYFKIVRSTQFDRYFNRKRVIGYSVAIFLATAALGMLPIFSVGIYEFSAYHGVCFTKWAPKNVVFRSIFYFYTIGITYPVLIFCYTRIFIKIRKHKRLVATNIHRSRGELQDLKTSSQLQVNANFAETPVVSVRLKNYQAKDHEEKAESQQEQSKEKKDMRGIRNEIRVTKVMFTVVIAYSLCWLPALVVTIMALSQTVTVDGSVLYFIVTIVDLKVFLNPLIYGLWNPQYRKGIKSLLIETISQEGSSNTQGDANNVSRHS